jgi:ABC-type dipeptide/oligopeptide/nickel transport system permease component
MSRYILRRLLFLIPVLFGVSLVVFSLLHLAPGDPAMLIAGQTASVESVAAIRVDLGLDRPLPEQYGIFVWHLAHGDLGRSLIMKVPVMDLIVQAFPVTLYVTLLGLLLSILIGIPAGVIAAVRQNTWVDQLCMGGAILGVSIPSFWLSLALMYLFAVRWHVVPVSGYDGFKSLILPAVTLGLTGAGLLARITRAGMLETLNQDFIRTARAKGVSSAGVQYGHALRNVLLPLVTLIGLRVGYTIGGAVVVETVFGLPGTGQLLFNGISMRDYPVVQGLLVVLALTVTLGNLLADLSYSVIDPQIRYT